MMLEIKTINRRVSRLVTNYVIACFLFCSSAFQFSFSQDIELFLQQGHTDRVMSAAYSNNGQYIATGGMDNVVKLWEVKTGFLVRTFQGHQGMVYDLHFSPDDNFIYSLSYDDLSLRKWDLFIDSAIAIYQFKDGSSEFELVSQGKFLIASTNKGLIKLDSEKLNLIGSCSIEQVSDLFYDWAKNILMVSSDVYGKNELLSINPEDLKLIETQKLNFRMDEASLMDGNLIFSDDKDLFVYNLITKEKKQFSSTFNSNITSIGSSANQGLISVGTRTGETFLGGLENGFKSLSDSHLAAVNDVVFNKNGTRYITASNDWTAKLWDSAHGELVDELKTDGDHVLHMSKAENAQYFIFSSGNSSNGNTIGFWDLLQGKSSFLQSQLGSEEAFLKVSTVKGNSAVFAVSTTGTSYWYTYPSGSPSIAHKVDGVEATCIATIPGGKTSCVGNDKGELIVWRPDRDKKEEYKISSNELKCLKFSLNGNLALTGDSEGRLILVNAKTFQPIDSFNTHGLNSGYKDENWKISYGSSMKVDLSSSEKQTINAVSIADVAIIDSTIAVSCGGNRISVVDLSKRKIRFHILEEQAGFASVDISSDGKMIVASGADAIIHVYSVMDGKKLFDLHGHQNEVRSVFFSPKQNFVLSTGLDGQLKIWEISDRSELLSFMTANGGKDELIYDKYGNYFGSKGASSLISFRKGNDIMPFNRFDLKANRPDLIMQKLSKYTELELGKPVNKNLIKSLNQAYLKRLARSGITEEELSVSKQLPTLKIINSKNEFGSNAKEIQLEIDAKDNSVKLRSIHVLVNGVPLFGSVGFPLKAKEFKGALNVPLSYGENLIEVYCVNSEGSMSLSELMKVRSTIPVTSSIYYLGIGVSEYADTNFRLKYARKDVEDMAKKIREIDPKANIKLLVDNEVTIEKIRELKSFIANAKVDDKIIIHVSGHGLLSPDLNYYFATSDVDFSKPERRGLMIQELEQLMEGIDARNKLLLLDACNSGEQDVSVGQSNQKLNVSEKGFATKGAAQLGQTNSFELMKTIFTDIQVASGTTIIASSSGSYFSFESETYRNGVFTHCVKLALNGEADKDKNGHVSIEELKTFVSQKVVELTKGKQQPTIRREIVGPDWYFY